MHLGSPSQLFLGLLSILSQADAIWSRPSELENCPGHRISKPRDDLNKAVKYGITGDRLSVLRCYCEGVDKWGYILEANYTNYHNGHSYFAKWETANDQIVNDGSGIPQSWDAHTRSGKLICDTDADNNKFCYEMRFDEGDFPSQKSMQPVDRFHFNGQTRQVGQRGSPKSETHKTFPNERPPPEECDGACWALGEMDTARDIFDDWSKILVVPGFDDFPKICSHKEVYTDLDDMCSDCKK